MGTLFNGVPVPPVYLLMKGFKHLFQTMGLRVEITGEGQANVRVVWWCNHAMSEMLIIIRLQR